jgi:PTH1 family peptidyl-tRNA hydrolase
MENRFKARLAKTNRAGRRIFLCQPQTYMNLSGEAVGALTSYYQIPHDRVIVIVDDADLPLGTVRLRTGGGCGGHHGLESIEQHMGTQDYARLRLGIGRNSQPDRQIRDYVLSGFLPEEAKIWKKVIETASRQTECWLTEGCQPAMNRFNGSVEIPVKKEI